jgi:hypothetical protein
VRIEPRGGVENILDQHTIPLRLKSPEVQILGVVIDANDDFSGRWRRLHQLLIPFFPDVPYDMQSEGLIVGNSSGKRVGVWIMPDNRSRGMLETFLQVLIPNEFAAVWDHAKVSVAEARKCGAPCTDKHLDKAHIYTWLAWQSPPGERFGTAILKNILDAKSEKAAQFVDWFRKLYEL